MNDLDLYAMFMLGILGTGHCIGMCGPLIFAFPASTGKFTPHLLYHLGRTITYVAIGAAMGAFGAGLAELAAATGEDHTVWIAHIKTILRILAALFLSIFGVARLGITPEPGWLSAASPNKIPGFRKVLKTAVVQKGQIDMLFLGLMLGFLPCGLSFAAFARALPTGNPFAGAILLFAFAVGTVPGLLLLGTGAAKIIRRYQRPSDILAGLLMIYMAVKLGVKAFSALLQ